VPSKLIERDRERQPGSQERVTTSHREEKISFAGVDQLLADIDADRPNLLR
jgi:hypothetical protein